MPGDRLLGSFVLRVSIGGGRRTIALTSILTGESQRFEGFGALATYLERTTGNAVVDAEDPGPASGGPAAS